MTAPYHTAPETVRLAWDALVIASASLVLAERLRGRGVLIESDEAADHARAVRVYRSELLRAGYRMKLRRLMHLTKEGRGLSEQVADLL